MVLRGLASNNETNTAAIIEAGAVPPLVALLSGGPESKAAKEAATALYNLMFGTNPTRAVGRYGPGGGWGGGPEAPPNVTEGAGQAPPLTAWRPYAYSPANLLGGLERSVGGGRGAANGRSAKPSCDRAARPELSPQPGEPSGHA